MAWSNVLNQYQCRADLIPNFVEIIKKGSLKQLTQLLKLLQKVIPMSRIRAKAKIVEMQINELKKKK